VARLSQGASPKVRPRLPATINGENVMPYNAKDLLGQLMGSNMAPSADQRVRHAVGSDGLGSPGNPLSGLMESLTRGGTGSGAQGEGLGGIADIAKQVFGGARRGVEQNNPLAVGGLGALAGLLLGGKGGALGGGALALLGSLAYAALNPNKAEATDPADIAKNGPLGLREPQTPAEEAELERHANVILLAMINAAKADGQVSEQEFQRITGKLRENGAESDGMSFILAELQKPVNMQAFVDQIKTPELAAEAYAASLLAIEVDTEAERTYLRDLQRSLNLPADAVARLHSALGVAPV
jgi:uncharacterized membrane protein YebE (DUF533 family)